MCMQVAYKGLVRPVRKMLAQMALGFLRCNLSACPKKFKEAAYEYIPLNMHQHSSRFWDSIQFT